MKRLLMLTVAVLMLQGIALGNEAINEDQALRCILGEARNQPYKGMCAVGEVLRRSPKIPFYGASTIFYEDGSWFAVEKEKAVLIPPKLVEKARRAWAESVYSDYSKGATHFEGTDFPIPKWARKMEVTTTIGSQRFFK